MIKNKVHTFENIFKNYSRSIKAIFNIISIHLPDKSFQEKNFLFNQVVYNTIINNNVYKNWINRHAFIDIFEITREIVVYVIADLFSDEKNFKIKKASSKYKDTHHKDIKIDHILKIFELDRNYIEFIDGFKQYQSIRNCLTHRSGEVTKIDKPPLFLNFYKITYEIYEGRKILEASDDVGKIIKLITKNEDKKNDIFVVFNSTANTVKYEENDRILITDEAIFSTSLYLFQNVKSIFINLLSDEISNIKLLLEKYNPFKINIKKKE